MQALAARIAALARIWIDAELGRWSQAVNDPGNRRGIIFSSRTSRVVNLVSGRMQRTNIESL
jgi:hypothetical protein